MWTRPYDVKRTSSAAYFIVCPRMPLWCLDRMDDNENWDFGIYAPGNLEAHSLFSNEVVEFLSFL